MRFSRPLLIALALLNTALAQTDIPTVQKPVTQAGNGVSAPRQANGAATGGYRSQILGFIGLSIDLPSEWRLVSTVKPTFTQPAGMVFNLTGTVAVLTLSHEIMEASPELYVKLRQASLSNVMPDYRNLSSASIEHEGWSGVRLTGNGTKSDIQFRIFSEMFSRDREHYLISIASPEETFIKHAAEFNKLLASVHIKGLTAAAGNASDFATGPMTPPSLPGAAATSVIPSVTQAEAAGSISTTPAPAGASSGSATDTAPAALSYRAGLEAFSRENFPAAVQYFRDAVSKAPMHAMAWNELGRSYLQLHRYGDAAMAFRRQAEVRPAHRMAYNNLGIALEADGHLDEAEAAFRKQSAVDPENRFAHGRLGLLLLRRKNYGAAVAELQAGLRYDPRSTTLAVALGRAYLDLGETENGISALEDAAGGSSDPMVLNSVAYALASHELRLDLAQKHAELALAIINPSLRNLNLSHITPADMRRAASLCMLWDTMGWVQYKDGKLRAAERYLRSAWLLSPNPVMGAHLGETLERMGRKEDAAGVYAATLAAYHPRTDVLMETPEEVTAVRRHLEALAGGSAAAEARINSAVQAASGRVVQIAGPDVKGEADFLVLIGPDGKPEDGRFISGAAELRGLEARLQTVAYPFSFPERAGARMVLGLHARCGGSKPCTATMYDVQVAVGMPLTQTEQVRAPVLLSLGKSSSVEVLSDTHGVDLGPYLARLSQDVRAKWFGLIPEVARPPLLKSGEATVQFVVLKDGKIDDIKIEAPSGDASPDRAAVGAVFSSSPAPPLPTEFKGDRIALRFHFLYNREKEPPSAAVGGPR